MLIKKRFLILSFFMISGIALLSSILTGCAFIQDPIFNYGLSKERSKSNLEIKTTQIKGSPVTYLERQGQGDTIVLLHGITSNKDFWLGFVRYIPNEYRVLCLDMIGHGDFPQDTLKNYSSEQLMQGVSDIIDHLQIKKFHLVGHSLGGLIATLYTANHPEKIISLGLFDSAGAISSQLSDLELAVKENKNPFFVQTPEDFDRFLGFAYYQIPKAPWPVFPVMERRRIQQNPFNMKMFNDSIGKFYSSYTTEDMIHFLKRISVPTLVVWGNNDRMVHVSCIEAYKRYLSNVKTVIIPNCGHLPPIEKTKESAEIYTGFLKQL